MTDKDSKTILTRKFAEGLDNVYNRICQASTALEEIRPHGGFSDSDHYINIHSVLLQEIMDELKVDCHSDIMPVVKFLMRKYET